MRKRQDTSKDQLRDLFLPASSPLPKSPEPPHMILCLNMTLHIEAKQAQSERLSVSLAKGRVHSPLSAFFTLQPIIWLWVSSWLVLPSHNIGFRCCVLLLGTLKKLQEGRVCSAHSCISSNKYHLVVEEKKGQWRREKQTRQGESHMSLVLPISPQLA